ncbi:MAG: hypothetical protein KatS3mg129_2797 [Leptospiraceae bacterium]|nr:MAG: hypothetical protein KatS3mg129_2797 [Leptospiraceae bacterium]
MKYIKAIIMIFIIIMMSINCGNKKKPFLWFLTGLSEQGIITNNSGNTSSAIVGDNNPSNSGNTSNSNTGSLQITYDNTQFTQQQNPDGSFDGVVLAGPDDNTNAFGAVVPSCADVSCLLDNILSTIANWNEVATNGYSLINRQPISNVIIPTEVASLQLTLNQSYTANDVRNSLIELIGTIDGSGNVSNFPDDPPSANLDTQFRIVIQASQDENGNAVVLVGVTTVNNYENVEDALTGLTDGTNVGPVDSTPKDYIDILLADNPPKADFLFVVDNSGSMSQEQNAVANNSLAFFDRLNNLGVDFKIGTITTDNSNLRNTGFTSDRTQFENDIQVGTSGSGKESCTYYAEKALSNSSPNNMNAVLTNGNGSLNTIANAGYPRNGSNLTVICITDESDAYTKWDGSGSNDDNPRFNLIDNIFTQNNISFYGVIPLNDSGQYGSCTGVNGNANVTYNFSNFPQGALDLKSLAINTGGSVSSICGENYGAFLQQLADQVAAKATSYSLTRIPISSTIKVYVNDVEIPRTSNPPVGTTGYKYLSSENKIVFTGKLPSVGSQIKIAYQSYQ